MAWTVNNNTEKEYFRERGIPFLTDSAVRETEDSWEPPKRKIILSNIGQPCRSMLLILVVSAVMLYISLFCLKT